jgi:hypothetical protein
LPDWAVPNRSLARDIDLSAPPVVRSQTPEGTTLALPKPMPPSANTGQPASGQSTGIPLPERPPGFGVDVKAPALDAKPAPKGDIIQTSMASQGKVRVRVRAWVNGRPIFDDELIEWAAGKEMAEAHNSGKMTEYFNSKLDDLIEKELIYQEVVKKLEKNAPHQLEEMRAYIDQEMEKYLQTWRKSQMPEERVRTLEPVARRLLERNIFANEYARGRIKPALASLLNLSQVSEYYENHKNEFQTVDKVVWQDIFIPISPNLPTVEHARRFGEDLLNKCLKPGDFERLMVYNEGDSKLRGGEGLGQRLGRRDPKTGEWLAGDIRPVELEEALSKLREGDFGPVVPFSTGVHLIRVTKREYAGQMPLDEKVQKIIRKKLEAELFEREYRQLVKELEVRSVVHVVREEGLQPWRRGDKSGKLIRPAGLDR